MCSPNLPASYARAIELSGLGIEYVRVHAREWVADCFWMDLLDESDVLALSDADLFGGIDRHYAGGFNAFLDDIKPVRVPGR